LFAQLCCTSDVTERKSKEASCTPYFQFDEVDHYFLDIDEIAVWKIQEKDNKTQREVKQMEILLDYTPDELSDTIQLRDIQELGFIKKGLSSGSFRQLNEIFCEREHEETIEMSCIAVYRDILVFKRRNQIIGTIKICFDCEQYIIAGASQNTDDFGQSGDYQRLYSILH
jgi:hypothetical protein